MSDLVSRRRWAGYVTATAGAVWAAAAAQPAMAQTATAPPDDYTAAKERIARANKELSAFAVPMAVEPAFTFRA